VQARGCPDWLHDSWKCAKVLFSSALTIEKLDLFLNVHVGIQEAGQFHAKLMGIFSRRRWYAINELLHWCTCSKLLISTFSSKAISTTYMYTYLPPLKWVGEDKYTVTQCDMGFYVHSPTCRDWLQESYTYTLCKHVAMFSFLGSPRQLPYVCRPTVEILSFSWVNEWV
jgi:hypothetical protein